MSKQSIYNHLRAAGLPRFAVLALQANFAGESDNESCRLQGDFNSDRGPSRDYAQRVDAGLISDLVFATDAKGWGLAQWTYRPRKRALLDFCRYRCASIADEATQCDFVLFELAHDFPDLYAFLLRATPSDFYTAVERICREYENPEVKNIEDRYKWGKQLERELTEEPVSAADTAGPPADATESDEPTDPFWPPRMLCVGMVGADVMALQGLLMARGYNCEGASGIFDTRTHNMVMAFQAESGLKADGVAGPKTWTALLSR